MIKRTGIISGTYDIYTPLYPVLNFHSSCLKHVLAVMEERVQHLVRAIE
jgi:hypothetical protein